MTKQEVVDIVSSLSAEQQVLWMTDLGYQFTVSARDGYPFQETPGNITYLQGFNELQHAVYGRILQLRRSEEWTLGSFLDRLIETGRVYGIEGHISWGIKRSLERFR